MVRKTRGRRPKDPEARCSRRVILGCQPGEALMLRALAHRDGTSAAGIVRAWIAGDWDDGALAVYAAHVARLPRDKKPWRKRV